MRTRSHGSNRYVKNATTTRPVAPFEYVDQNGVEYTADQYPLPSAPPIVADGNGTLMLSDGGGSGPSHAPSSVGVLGGVALPITPSRASHALNIAVVDGRRSQYCWCADTDDPLHRYVTGRGSSNPGVRATRR